MNTKILFVLFLSIFTAVLGQGLVVPLLPVYANSMGGVRFYYRVIFGIFSVSRSLFLPIFGNLSDKKGRKPFIVWDYRSISLPLLLFSFLTVSWGSSSLGCYRESRQQ